MNKFGVRDKLNSLDLQIAQSQAERESQTELSMNEEKKKPSPKNSVLDKIMKQKQKELESLEARLAVRQQKNSDTFTKLKDEKEKRNQLTKKVVDLLDAYEYLFEKIKETRPEEMQLQMEDIIKC